MLIGPCALTCIFYSEAVGVVQHSPRQSAYALSTDAAHSMAARQTTARGAVPAPTSQPDLGIKHPSSGRFNQPRTVSTGGMSYSKLPSGACELIRSLRVSRLADVQDTESDISPNLAPSIGRAHVNGLCTDCRVLCVLNWDGLFAGD